jgi:hypothetical protein
VTAAVARENVDGVLREAGAEGEVDLLSVDIDGNDLWVWEALTAVSPRVVICEYNSLFGPDRAVTIPYEPDFDRKRRWGLYYGASLAALTEIGRQKGYRLVAVEPRGVNAYFLRDDVATEIPAVAPQHVFRTLDKHERRLREGLDFYGELASRGLELVEVRAKR